MKVNSCQLLYVYSHIIEISQIILIKIQTKTDLINNKIFYFQQVRQSKVQYSKIKEVKILGAKKCSVSKISSSFIPPWGRVTATSLKINQCFFCGCEISQAGVHHGTV
jgi:hypothetical protein